MKLFNRKLFCCTLLFSVAAVLISCQIKVPIEKMSLARLRISRAIEVKAEKYAPEELKKAEALLYKCHDDIKKEDLKSADSDAEGALKSADSAVEKSLPLLSGDTLKEAKILYDAGRNLYTEEELPGEFASAGQKIDEAEKLHAGASYWESYLITSRFVADFKQKISDRLSELKQKAMDNINTAKGSLESTGKFDENTKHTAVLEKAAVLITGSEELFEKGSYIQSLAKSNEAIEILNTLKITIEKEKEEEERTRIAEEEAKEKEKEKLKDKEKEKEGKEEGKRYYRVKYRPKNRDCLWKIAMYMYKDARLWPLIYAANKDKIKNPDLIFPGQLLVIPPVPEKKKKKVKEEEKDAIRPEEKT